MTYILATPNPDNWRALDTMAQESWDETFAHFYSPQDLAAFKAQAFGEGGWLHSDLNNPDVIWQVAYQDGAEIGFIKLMPPTLEQAGPNDLMIGQIYILSPWHGGGVAQSLMQWAIDTGRARGADGLILTVFEENPRAIRFYGKYGFVHVGDCVFPVGEQMDRDLVLRLTL